MWLSFLILSSVCVALLFSMLHKECAVVAFQVSRRTILKITFCCLIKKTCCHDNLSLPINKILSCCSLFSWALRTISFGWSEAKEVWHWHYFWDNRQAGKSWWNVILMVYTHHREQIHKRWVRFSQSRQTDC